MAEPLTREEWENLSGNTALLRAHSRNGFVARLLATIAALNKQIAAADELLATVRGLRFATIEEAAKFRAALDAYRKEFPQ